MRDADPAGGSPRKDDAGRPPSRRQKSGKIAKGPPKQKVPRSFAQGSPPVPEGQHFTSLRCGSGTPALHTCTAYKGINARGWPLTRNCIARHVPVSLALPAPSTAGAGERAAFIGRDALPRAPSGTFPSWNFSICPGPFVLFEFITPCACAMEGGTRRLSEDYWQQPAPHHTHPFPP